MTIEELEKENEELKQRIRALEQENALLRKGSNSGFITS